MNIRNYSPATTHIPDGYIPVVNKDCFARNNNPIVSPAVRTLIPSEYRKPVVNKTTVVTRSQFIDLVNDPKVKTYTPDDYVPCAGNQDIWLFKPFHKWYGMIKKVKFVVNIPRIGGAGFEDAMESLLDQAQEILTTNARK